MAVARKRRQGQSLVAEEFARLAEKFFPGRSLRRPFSFSVGGSTMSDRPERFGFGVIGCGVISDVHLAAIESLPDARLVAVCDKNEAAARAKAEQHGCDYHVSHHDLLARDDLHIVNIVVPSGLHAALGIDAARAGKHVICTKPIDITLEAIDALIAAGDENGVKIAATHQLRAYPVYLRIKEALASGRLGRPLYANAFVPWYRSDQYYSDGWHGTRRLDGGGALMNQSIHYLDLLLFIMGRAQRVAGFAAALGHGNIEVEDCASAAVLFESGAQGLIQGTTCTYLGKPARLEVHGTKGNVLVEGDDLRLWEIEGEPVERIAEHETVTSAADPRAGLERGIGAHAAQIQDVIDAVREGREPKLSGREARRAVELILAIYRSSERGEVVELGNG
jgi:predicted dehydrogenase